MMIPFISNGIAFGYTPDIVFVAGDIGEGKKRLLQAIVKNTKGRQYAFR